MSLEKLPDSIIINLSDYIDNIHYIKIFNKKRRQDLFNKLIIKKNIETKKNIKNENINTINSNDYIYKKKIIKFDRNINIPEPINSNDNLNW